MLAAIVEPVSNKNLVTAILNGLGTEFYMLVTTIESLYSLSQIFFALQACLLNYETRCNIIFSLTPSALLVSQTSPSTPFAPLAYHTHPSSTSIHSHSFHVRGCNNFTIETAIAFAIEPAMTTTPNEALRLHLNYNAIIAMGFWSLCLQLFSTFLFCNHQIKAHSTISPHFSGYYTIVLTSWTWLVP